MASRKPNQRVISGALLDRKSTDLKEKHKKGRDDHKTSNCEGQISDNTGKENNETGEESNIDVRETIVKSSKASVSASSASRRKELMSVCQEASAQPIIAFVTSVQKSGASCLNDIMQSSRPSDLAILWDGISKHLPQHLAQGDKPVTLTHFSKLFLLVITFEQVNSDYVEAVALLAASSLGDSKITLPASLKSVVISLHEILLDLESESSAQDSVSRLCEAWFIGDFEGKNCVVPQTMLYLLMRSVGENGRLVDVKRVFAMREAFTLLEIGGQSFQSVQESLMRAAIHPNFVMHDEGRRFLALVLSLNPQLTSMLHKAIKSQIPRCRNSMLAQYGELYHAAWKRSAGPVLHVLEYDCVQELAHHCIHAGTPALSAALRRVLHAFHENKKFKAVDEMLHRVYEAVLWRGLKVANPAVRRQAALLFVDAFPVQDPDAPNADFEQSLQSQINALHALLQDRVPDVREVGVQCVCRVLSVFWDLLPTQTSGLFLHHLITQLSADAAAPAVRAAVLRGVAFVLDNHVTHPMLQGMLVHLRPLIHDTSERVRVAMCDLLLKVKSVKAIRFYDVVPLDDLLDRIVADAARPAVVTRLTALLQASYLPPTKPPPEQLARAMAMIHQSPAAAEVFYRQAAVDAPAQVVVNLFVLLYHSLSIILQKRSSRAARAAGGPSAAGKGAARGRAAGKAKRRAAGESKRRGAQAEDSDGEGAEDEGDDQERAGHGGRKAAGGEEEEEGEEEAGVGDVLGVLAALMQSLRPRLDEEANHKLRGYVTEHVPTSRIVALLEGCLDVRAESAVWRLAAVLPEPAGDDVAARCLAGLRALRADDPHRAARAGPMLECVVLWARQKTLLRSLQSGVLAALAAPPAAGAGGGRATPSSSADASSAAADGKRARRQKSEAASAPAGRQSEGGEGGEWECTGQVLWCGHFLLSAEALRTRILLSPSQLAPLQRALAAVLPVLEARIAAAPSSPAAGGAVRRAAVAAAAGGSCRMSDEEALDAVLLHGKYCLHLLCGAGAAGAGTGPDDLEALLDWCTHRIAPHIALSSPPAEVPAAEVAGAASKRKGGKKAAVAAAAETEAGAERAGGGGARLAGEVCRRVLMIAAEVVVVGRLDASARLPDAVLALAQAVVDSVAAAAAASGRSREEVSAAAAATQHAAWKVTVLLLRARRADAAVCRLAGQLVEVSPPAALRGLRSPLRDAFAEATAAADAAAAEGEGVVPSPDAAAAAAGLDGLCDALIEGFLGRNGRADAPDDAGEGDLRLPVVIAQAAWAAGPAPARHLSSRLAAALARAADAPAAYALLELVDALAAGPAKPSASRAGAGAGAAAKGASAAPAVKASAGLAAELQAAVRAIRDGGAARFAAAGSVCAGGGKKKGAGGDVEELARDVLKRLAGA